jgi:uncharacterized membrane protein (GlpM family)
MKNIIYWLPRFLAIVLIGFFGVFALDVVGESQWLLAMIMHLIPSFVLIALTIVAWKREFIGGILFLAAGVIAAIFYHSFIIAAPIFVIGALFLVSKLASRN